MPELVSSASKYRPQRDVFSHRSSDLFCQVRRLLTVFCSNPYPLKMTINEHTCNALHKSSVYLHFDKEVPAWTLNIQKEATESDLEQNGCLENQPVSIL